SVYLSCLQLTAYQQLHPDARWSIGEVEKRIEEYIAGGREL
ncbi:hypothetical protein LEMLEM_LOCUS6932, partial [Lemmus lemmus]